MADGIDKNDFIAFKVFRKGLHQIKMVAYMSSLRARVERVIEPKLNEILKFYLDVFEYATGLEK